MKILVYSENEYGCGASIVSWLLAEEFAGQGNEVIFLFQNKHPNGPISETIQKIHLNFWKVGILQKLFVANNFAWVVIYAMLAKLPFLQKINDFFIHKRRLCKFHQNRIICESLLKKIIQKEKPDALHLHSVPTNLSYCVINTISQQILTIWTFHNCFPTKGYTTRYKKLDGKWMETYADFTFQEVNLEAKNQLFATNDSIKYITPSHWLKNLISDDIASSENIQVIHNGLSPKTFQPKNKLAIREKLGLNSNKKYALTIIGKLHLAHKNYKILNEAFQKIKDENIELVVIGNRGNWTTPFPENIRFLGPIFDNDLKSDYLCAADLFIVPSLADNFPTVVLESMFCGTPVLGANIGGIPEMVIPNKTGELFNPYDAEELANKLKKLINNSTKLSEMSKNCLEISAEKFTLEKSAMDYLELMKK